jgi:hypothetical protein
MYTEFTLPEIPKSKEKQIELLERAVGELFSWIMTDKGWDNPGSIADELDDEVNKIAHRAFEKYCEYTNE